VPFSAGSLLTSRAVVRMTRRFGPRAVLVGGSLTISAAGAFFAVEHSALWQAFVTLGVVGVGFGLTFAAIPGLIASAVPSREAGSSMGLYQVVRYIGFSMGSALAAAILSAHTATDATLPTVDGYVAALWVGTGICALSALASFVLGDRASEVAAARQTRRAT